MAQFRKTYTQQLEEYSPGPVIPPGKFNPACPGNLKADDLADFAAQGSTQLI